jgi:hypothetical protein
MSSCSIVVSIRSREDVFNLCQFSSQLACQPPFLIRGIVLHSTKSKCEPFEKGGNDNLRAQPTPRSCGNFVESTRQYCRIGGFGYLGKERELDNINDFYMAGSDATLAVGFVTAS